MHWHDMIEILWKYNYENIRIKLRDSLIGIDVRTCFIILDTTASIGEQDYLQIPKTLNLKRGPGFFHQ